MWTRVQRVEAREAYEQLFRQAGPALWGSLYAFTGGRTDIAEDAMAEAFARAMERASTIRDPLAWIYRAAFPIRCGRTQTRAATARRGSRARGRASCRGIGGSQAGHAVSLPASTARPDPSLRRGSTR